jgi:hypothetical protein
MKKLVLLFVLVFSATRDIQPLDLVEVGKWSHDEYWDEKNKSLGVKGTRYLCMLAHDQVLCEEWREKNRDYNTRYYYIKNYITGETAYRFENKTRLYGEDWPRDGAGLDMFVKDQYGAYIFLLKDGGLTLFDVKEMKEYIPGEPLKRPDHIYYTRGSGGERQILKHNIAVGKIEEIRFGKLSREELQLLQPSNSGYYRTLEAIGNNRLRLYNNYRDCVLQLDEAMAEIISVTDRRVDERRRENAVDYIIPINGDNYIGFKSMIWPYPLDEINGYYYVLLLDENGGIEKEYKDIAMVQNDTSMGYTSMSTLCLISPNKQYVMLFNTYSSTDRDVYVYKIMYQAIGILNDDRVRVRSEPNLTGAVLGVVNRGDKVEILEAGREKQKIGDMESVWYKIQTNTNIEGWIFGAYIDMTGAN